MTATRLESCVEQSNCAQRTRRRVRMRPWHLCCICALTWAFSPTEAANTPTYRAVDDVHYDESVPVVADKQPLKNDKLKNKEKYVPPPNPLAHVSPSLPTPHKPPEGDSVSTPTQEKLKNDKKQRLKQEEALLHQREKYVPPPHPSVLVIPSAPTAHNLPESDAFLIWCRQLLGIQTSLVVETFPYYDYMQLRMNQSDDEEFCEDDEALLSVLDFPMIGIRGLSASRDIAVGEVVISIPFHAMISVPTTIDHDPVLSRILGPVARVKHGWDDSYYELPLLTVAILYHRQLGDASPLHHYIDVLQTSPQSMPFLWDKEHLKREATEGVRKIARGIQRDIKEMYDAVMTVLIKEHSDLFADREGEWMYSYPMFQWAFAMVNSRHWHLPIPDLDLPDGTPIAAMKAKNAPVHRSNLSVSTFTEQVPPADQPTEEWVKGQEEAEASEEARAVESEKKLLKSHSFLAPVADLLNFGPPCTVGSYNIEKRAFELIATCSFIAGQEVTYWYSDDCDDVIIANYGFSHPMVPKCPTADDWRQQSELWRRRAEGIEEELGHANEELDRLDLELEQVHSVLQKCNCDDDSLEPRAAARRESHKSRKEPTKLRHDRHEAGVRGGTGNGNGSNERHGVRRKWHHPKSDLGL